MSLNRWKWVQLNAWVLTDKCDMEWALTFISVRITAVSVYILLITLLQSRQLRLLRKYGNERNAKKCRPLIGLCNFLDQTPTVANPYRILRNWWRTLISVPCSKHEELEISRFGCHWKGMFCLRMVAVWYLCLRN